MDAAARERALLLAALGHYDEALAELAPPAGGAGADPVQGASPGEVEAAGGGAVESRSGPGTAAEVDPALVVLRAQIALAAGRAPLALEFLTGAPADVAVLDTRAMALVDLRRFRDAARLGSEILDGRATDVDALCAGAGILAVARNGPRALSAAWDAVRLAPEQARTHLVLGLVAAGLGQYELAARAYAEALDREPDLQSLATDPGVGRLALRRQHQALEHLLGLAASGTSLKAAAARAPTPPTHDRGETDHGDAARDRGATDRGRGGAGRRGKGEGSAEAGRRFAASRPAADRPAAAAPPSGAGPRAAATPSGGGYPAADGGAAAAPAGGAGFGRRVCGTAGGAGLVVLLGLPVLDGAARLLAALAALVVVAAAAVLWWRSGRQPAPGRYRLAALAGALLTAGALAAGAAGAGWWPTAAATAAALLLAWRAR
ncbi:hypothetical protein GCM10010124_01300 [Pilimelia terevasa]|uniref:Tetratricopeptide repeat protein n=1 Tax=Pilimelia terevasa TaxID=53372 RepID=A0A8J3FDS1_9ACTN|nr:hypothetical protein [Pilimelia terevasa]GGK12519.1 hypothetical protein GCM10010124_01300 [Pilimelia terevasa]